MRREDGVKSIYVWTQEMADSELLRDKDLRGTGNTGQEFFVGKRIVLAMWRSESGARLPRVSRPKG